MLLQDSFVQSFAKPISGKAASIVHVEKSQPGKKAQKNYYNTRLEEL